MHYLLLIALGILPGAWVAFAPPSRGLRFAERLAIAAALSPAVASLELALLRLGGGGGRVSALALLLANLPALALVVARREPLSRPAWGALLPAALVAGAPFVWLAVLWGAVPGMRAFGWHNLMHVDIAYQLLRPPLLPEEPELAGVPLAYAWFSHGYTALQGLVADRPPTLLYPVSNALLAAATLVLVQRAARVLGAAPPFALLAAALALLGSHVPRELAQLVLGFGPELRELFGDRRLILPLTKFLHIDLLPGSFALLAAALLLGLRWLREPERGVAVLGVLVLAALAASYAIALPAALALGAGLAAADLLFSRGRRRERLRAWLPLAAAGLGLLVASALWLGAGAAAAVGPAPLARVPRRAWDALLAVAPFAALAVPAVAGALRRRDAALAGLALAGALLIGAYVLLEVRNLEYKYLVYARPCLALLAAVALERGCRRFGVAGSWWIAAGVVLSLAALSLAAALARPPPQSLRQRPPLREDHFALEHGGQQRHAAWLRAVRDATPPDTVLVAHGLDFHAGVFANRSLYFPCERRGELSAGYTFDAELNLVGYRGYPRELFERRARVVSALFQSRTRGPFLEALGRVRALGRPVAIHLSARSGPRLAWLRERGLGRRLHADRRSVVWYLEALEIPGARG